MPYKMFVMLIHGLSPHLTCDLTQDISTQDKIEIIQSRVILYLSYFILLVNVFQSSSPTLSSSTSVCFNAATGMMEPSDAGA